MLLRRIALITSLSLVIIATVVGGFFYYSGLRFATRSFVTGHKGIAETIASAIDPHEVARFLKPDSSDDPEYRRYAAFFSTIAQRDASITSCYLIYYDTEYDDLRYAVDGRLAPDDTVFVESEYFHFRASLVTGADTPRVTFRFDGRETAGPIKVPIANNSTTIEARSEPDAVTVAAVDGGKPPYDILHISGSRSEGYIMQTPFGDLSAENRRVDGFVDLHGMRVPVRLTYVPQGESMATPGTPFIGTVDERDQLRAAIFDAPAERDGAPSPVRDFRAVQVVFAPLTLDGRPFAALVINLYNNAISDLQSQVALISGILALTVFGASLAYSIFLSRYLVSPVARLSAAVEQVAAGNFTVRVDINRSDEFGKLASGFNQMTDRLRQAFSERGIHEQRLRQIAYTDELTGLKNRKAFFETIEEILLHAERGSHQPILAVLFLDVDHFKDVNDSKNHSAGDKVLTTVASRIESTVRKTDYVFRLGGDEFTVILLDLATETDASVVSQKILDAMLTPFVVDGTVFHLSVSIGIAIYPRDGRNGETLLRNSDTAIFEAKRQRNTFRHFSPEMQDRALRKLRMVSRLHEAIDAEEFSLVYQPIVDRARRVVAAEVLVRWVQPSVGIIPPSEFIPTAEETGLIVPLSRWIMRTACAQLRTWRRMGYRDLRLSINLSPRQIDGTSFVDEVFDLLDEFDLPPSSISLEITEGLLMERSNVIPALERLQAGGLSISIDDFGTGYSSLSRLEILPIDLIKIDKSFVDRLDPDRPDGSAINAIIRLVRGLNLEVLAEGVETPEQAETLFEAECDYIQGYVFSRPVQPIELPEVIDQLDRQAAVASPT